MSDINHLIHTNARVAFDQGVKTEQQRIITLLKEEKKESWHDTKSFLDVLIALIKGEQK